MTNFGTLRDANTGEALRPATRAYWQAGVDAGPAGVFMVDCDLDLVDESAAADVAPAIHGGRLWKVGMASVAGRTVYVEGGPRCFTVEIQASDDAGTIWQAQWPAENTPGDNARQVAEDTAANQNVATGDGWRVVVWEGANADQGAEPAYVWNSGS